LPTLSRWFVLAALVAVPACLSDGAPDPFTTEGACVAGQVEGCDCDGEGKQGYQICKSDGTFGICLCATKGCSAASCGATGCVLEEDCGECTEGTRLSCLCADPSPEREDNCRDDSK